MGVKIFLFEIQIGIWVGTWFFKFEFGIWFGIRLVYAWCTKMTKKLDHDWQCLIRFYLFWYTKTGIWSVIWLFSLYHGYVQYRRLWEMNRNDCFWLVCGQRIWCWGIRIANSFLLWWHLIGGSKRCGVEVKNIIRVFLWCVGNVEETISVYWTKNCHPNSFHDIIGNFNLCIFFSVNEQEIFYGSFAYFHLNLFHSKKTSHTIHTSVKNNPF